MLKKTTLAVIFMVISTLFATVGQLLWKYGLLELGGVFNFSFALGIVAYFVSSMMVILAFQRGELSLLYPILAASYALVSLFSVIIFNEPMNLFKISGIVIILVAVSLLGWGNNRKERKVVYG